MKWVKDYLKRVLKDPKTDEVTYFVDTEICYRQEEGNLGLARMIWMDYAKKVVHDKDLWIVLHIPSGYTVPLKKIPMKWKMSLKKMKEITEKLEDAAVWDKKSVFSDLNGYGELLRRIEDEFIKTKMRRK